MKFRQASEIEATLNKLNNDFYAFSQKLQGFSERVKKLQNECWNCEQLPIENLIGAIISAKELTLEVKSL